MSTAVFTRREWFVDSAGHPLLKETPVYCPVVCGRASLPPVDFIQLTLAGALLAGDKNELVRVGNKSTGKTRRVHPSKVLGILLDKEENYMSFSLHRRSKGGTGQSDAEVTSIEAVVIDLDAKHQPGEVATPEQIQRICDLMPEAVVIVANGVQVLLRPQYLISLLEQWRTTISDLVALGEFLAAQTGLEYDRACHVRRNNQPAKHKGHANRTAGHAKKAGRPVLLLAPLTDCIGSTNEALFRLNLPSADLSEGVIAPSREASYTDGENLDSVTRIIRPSPRGSLAAQRAEFLCISDLWADGVYRQRRNRTAVEADLCSAPWQHHKPEALAKTLAARKVYEVRDGERLTEEQWQQICADLEPLQFWIGPKSVKRHHMQRTATLRANRAWSFEWLYWFKHSPQWNLAFSDALHAFWNWPEYQTIRDMSLAALKSVESINEDLKYCWDEWSDASPLISKEQLSAIEGAIGSLKKGKFTRQDVSNTLPGKSETMIKRGLRVLTATGKLTITKASRSTFYTTKQTMTDTTPPENDDFPPFVPDECDDYPPEVSEVEPLEPVKSRRKTKQDRFKESKKRTTWDYSSTYEQDRAAALECQGDGLKFAGVSSHKFNNGATFNALYREIYKAVSTRTIDGKRFCCGPSLGRIYRVLAKAAPAFSSIGPDLQKLEFENTVSAKDYKERHNDFPRLLADGVPKIERAGYVSFTDFGSKAVRGNAGSIVQVLTEQQGQELLLSLQYHPWCRATRKTLVMLWEFGFQRLREWMSARLGEEVPALWLGWRTGKDGKPLVLQAGDDVLRHVTFGTIWDE